MSTQVVAGRAMEQAQLKRVISGDRVRHLGLVGAGALLVAGGVHIALGFEHAGSNFGTLALLAGLSQGALAVAFIVRPSIGLLSVITMLQLILVQLYVINVTVGLPTVIAHSHVGGTHEVAGLTLAWPGLIEGQGLVGKSAEGLAVVVALALRRVRVVSPAG